MFRASLMLLTRAQTWFGLTKHFSLKQDQSSSLRSAEHSSIGFITTRGTVPDQPVRTLLLGSQGYIYSGYFTRQVSGWGCFSFSSSFRARICCLNPNDTYFCSEFTAKSNHHSHVGQKIREISPELS